MPSSRRCSIRGTKKGFGLLDQGVTLLKDIPDDTKLTASQAIQKATAISGQPHVNQHALAEFLSGLEYPLHFLDFEPFGTAIPLFDHVRPYQKIPSQFSLHVVHAPGGKVEHAIFPADGRHDPRPEFMLKLEEYCGQDTEGMIWIVDALRALAGPEAGASTGAFR